MYYLQHERPCCIEYSNLSRRRKFLYLIQHGPERCKWLVKRVNEDIDVGQQFEINE